MYSETILHGEETQFLFIVKKSVSSLKQLNSILKIPLSIILRLTMVFLNNRYTQIDWRIFFSLTFQVKSDTVLHTNMNIPLYVYL